MRRGLGASERIRQDGSDSWRGCEEIAGTEAGTLRHRRAVGGSKPNLINPLLEQRDREALAVARSHGLFFMP